MATYYAKRALEILREEGPVELTKRSLKFIDRAVRPIKRKTTNRLRYCWYYLQYYGSTSNPNKIININPAEIGYVLTKKYVWSPLDINLIALEQNRPLRDITKYRKAYIILDGTWDSHKSPIEDCYPVKGLFEQFIEGKKWTETSEYDWYKQRGKDKERIRRHFDKHESCTNPWNKADSNQSIQSKFA